MPVFPSFVLNSALTNGLETEIRKSREPMKPISLLATAIVAAVSLSLVAQSNEGTSLVFRIGSFDGSSREFANGQPKRAVQFIVGQSNPATDWHAFQPVESTPRSSESAPRAIEFALQHSPSSTYALRVSLLIDHASVPLLGVNINGHFGTFYLDPKFDGSQGGWFPAL